MNVSLSAFCKRKKMLKNKLSQLLGGKQQTMVGNCFQRQKATMAFTMLY